MFLLSGSPSHKAARVKLQTSHQLTHALCCLLSQEAAALSDLKENCFAHCYTASEQATQSALFEDSSFVLKGFAGRASVRPGKKDTCMGSVRA